MPHSHDANEAIQSAEEASGHGIRAAWIGLAGMMATALAQVVIVAISGSIALLADTVHNLGHAATTIPLIIAFRLGRRSANGRYSYGYRRAEDLVGLFIGLIVGKVAYGEVMEILMGGSLGFMVGMILTGVLASRGGFRRRRGRVSRGRVCRHRRRGGQRACRGLFRSRLGRRGLADRILGWPRGGLRIHRSAGPNPRIAGPLPAEPRHAAGGNGLALTADALKREDSQRVVQTAVDEFGRIASER